MVLEVNDVVESDAGLYRVKAKNKFGEVAASINLNFSREYHPLFHCFKAERASTKYISRKGRGEMGQVSASYIAKDDLQKFLRSKGTRAKNGLSTILSFLPQSTEIRQRPLLFISKKGHKRLTKQDTCRPLSKNARNNMYSSVRIFAARCAVRRIPMKYGGIPERARGLIHNPRGKGIVRQ